MAFRRLAIVLIGSLVLPVSRARAGDILGVDNGGSLYSISSQSGEGCQFASSGLFGIECMAKDAGGTLWCVSDWGQNLARLDPVTGTGTVVGRLRLSGVTGLAAGPDGLLYAVSPYGGTGGDRLWTVDPQTLDTHLVGSTGFLFIEALAFSPGGVLYAWDGSYPLGAGLVSLDPSTGAGTDVNPSVSGPQIKGLAFDGSGNLWGGSYWIYTIDPTTGIHSTVGAGGHAQLSALEFAINGGGTCPVTYCTSQTTTNGCMPSISYVGVPSVSEKLWFYLVGSNLPSNSPCLLFYGHGAASLPFGGGTLCVQRPVVRTRKQPSGGLGSKCGGFLFVDFHTWIESGVDPTLTMGTRVFAQVWCLDPVAPLKSALSDAIEFTILP